MDTRLPKPVLRPGSTGMAATATDRHCVLVQVCEREGEGEREREREREGERGREGGKEGVHAQIKLYGLD